MFIYIFKISIINAKKFIKKWYKFIVEIEFSNLWIFIVIYLNFITIIKRILLRSLLIFFKKNKRTSRKEIYYRKPRFKKHRKNLFFKSKILVSVPFFFEILYVKKKKIQDPQRNDRTIHVNKHFFEGLRHIRKVACVKRKVVSGRTKGTFHRAMNNFIPSYSCKFSFVFHRDLAVAACCTSISIHSCQSL